MTEPKSAHANEGVLLYRAAGLTDTGRVRRNNEDNFAVDSGLGLFVVSDGMGGLQAGEVASEIVVKDLPALVREGLLSGGKALSVLSESIAVLGGRVVDLGIKNPSSRGAGATVVACLAHGRKAAIAHLGDSRAYLLREGSLERLTEDHSIVAMMLRLGQITKEQADNHYARNVISRYVGMQSDVTPEAREIDLIGGDRLLLCSDGLTNMVPEEEIAKMLIEEDVDSACRLLVDAANRAGGKDNIAVVLVAFEEPPLR
jgi:protein phosphatase